MTITTTTTTATTTATTTTIHNAAHTHAHINFQRRETTWKGHSRMMMMMMMRMDESWKYEELRETENSKSPIWIGKKKIKPYITLAWHWLCVMDISCSISTNTNIQKKTSFNNRLFDDDVSESADFSLKLYEHYNFQWVKRVFNWILINLYVVLKWVLI